MSSNDNNISPSSSSDPASSSSHNQQQEQQDRQELMKEVKEILQKDPSRMYSKEEILNLLVHKGKDSEIESLLAELEVASSLEEARSSIYATCRGGTVYYKWNKS